MQPRQYQTELIDKARDSIRKGNRSIIMQSPTGSGKTVTVASMIASSQGKGKTTFFLVHRAELIRQSSKAFSEFGIRHGVISDGYDSTTADVQICSIQTLARRLHRIKQPDLVIVDECHHIASESWSKIKSAWQQSVWIGLTATPHRMDGRGLNKHFSDMIYGPSVKWLIDNKYLSDYVAFAPTIPVVKGVKSIAGDFKRSDLESIMDKPQITGDIVKHYLAHARGKRAILFAPTIAFSERMAARFQEAGISAVHVDGETKDHERELATEKFNSGEIQIMCNVDLFGEGYDVPGIEAVILARPTKSLSLHLQQVGRGLRAVDGKTHCIILDHAGNLLRHGLPDDEFIWTLEGREKKKKEHNKVKLCKNCFFACRLTEKVCPHCKKEFESKERKISTASGQLSKIEKVNKRRDLLKEQRKCTSLKELIELGKRRGYNCPEGWAYNYMRSREYGRNNYTKHDPTKGFKA